MLNRYFLLSLAWFVASLYFLFKPAGHTAMPFAHFDKVAHAGLFFTQTWLIGKIWLNAGKSLPWRTLIILLLLWAGLSEVFQALFTVDRYGDAWDDLADTVGIVAAVFFLKRSEHGQRLS